MKRTARVIVASNRAATGVYPDRTGPLITRWLAQRNYETAGPIVVEDGEPVGAALRDCLADKVDVVITTGGTGIAPTDQTPEFTAPLLERTLPGLADAVRSAGKDKVPSAILSRGVAGIAGRTIVLNLPGSPGGVRDGLAVLDEILEHAVDQVSGGDHAQEGMSAPDAGSSLPLIARCAVTSSALSVTEHVDLVADAGAGAVLTFAGTVRDHDNGRMVRSLFYEGHPSAEDVLAGVVERVAGRHPGVRRVAVSHRLGALEIGDVALACVIASEHRAEGFVTCAEMVDEIKAQLPIWKHQVFTDGSDEWVNCP